jgi:uncharacterized membrane protein required for colicin V production
MLAFFTVLIMLAVAYAYLREGLFTAAVMCCNVFLAGLVAFNFWEPLADLLEPLLAGTILHGLEDALCLVGLFCVTLGALRTVTNLLSRTQIQFPEVLQRMGGVVFGLLTGYLVAGFLVCMLQTLPWHENFMSFDPLYEAGGESAARHILPPDRVWLAMMYRAGAYAFANNEDPRGAASSSLYDRYMTFDKYGSFELRYARFRRYGDSREPSPYLGEFDQEIHRTR